MGPVGAMGVLVRTTNPTFNAGTTIQDLALIYAFEIGFVSGARTTDQNYAFLKVNSARLFR
jgi:hypothetical protein